jgi:hypothetical protein
MNGSIGQWEDPLRSFKNNIQSTEVQQLMVRLEQLTNLLLSSSDKVWVFFLSKLVDLSIRYIC